MLALFPEIPERDQNLKSTPLNERTGIPRLFHIGFLPPWLIFLLRQSFFGRNEENDVFQVCIGRYPSTDFCRTVYQFFIFRVAVESVFLSANRFSTLLDWLRLRRKMKWKFHFRFSLRCKKPKSDFQFRFSIFSARKETEFKFTSRSPLFCFL